MHTSLHRKLARYGPCTMVRLARCVCGMSFWGLRAADGHLLATTSAACVCQYQRHWKIPQPQAPDRVAFAPRQRFTMGRVAA